MQLSAISLALTRLGWFSATFTPASLFTTGVNGAWYDPSDYSTLFQNSAGTTPVTAVEQPVGLMLDKRDTAYSTYFDGAGDYLSTPSSSSFDLGTSDFTMEAWVYQTSGTLAPILNRRRAAATEGWLFSAGEFSAYIGGAWRQSVITATVTNNMWIHVALVRSGNVFALYHNGVSKGSYTNSGAVQDLVQPVVVGVGGGTTEVLLTGYISNLRIVKGTALYTANFTPPTGPLTAVAGTSLLTCGTSWSGNPAITSNGNVRADKLNPFTTGTGNHAFNGSGNSANFPVLSARYNLLTKSEDFTGWSISNSTLTTNTITSDGVAAAHGAYQAISATNSTYVFSVEAKPNGTNFITLACNTGTVQQYCSATFNVSTGVMTKSAVGSGAGAIVSTSCVASVDGYYKCTIVFTLTVVNANIYLATNGTPTLDDYGRQVFTQSGLSAYVRKADIRVANDALNQPAYQRVNTSTDYDTVGFKPYLRFNGTNQWLQTNSIDFSYGDKMFVSAGVRKLSDGSPYVLLESSTDSAANSGVFAMFYPVGSALPQPAFRSGGSTKPLTYPASGYIAPITNVLSGIGDISGDQAILRANGAQSAISTADQGTGNYGNYPMFVGARAGTSLRFNGRLYQLVVVGKQASSGEIASTEAFVATKTGVTL